MLRHSLPVLPTSRSKPSPYGSTLALLAPLGATYDVRREGEALTDGAVVDRVRLLRIWKPSAKKKKKTRAKVQPGCIFRFPQGQRASVLLSDATETILQQETVKCHNDMSQPTPTDDPYI
jgi:hypothetical protein